MELGNLTSGILGVLKSIKFRIFHFPKTPEKRLMKKVKEYSSWLIGKTLVQKQELLNIGAENSSYRKHELPNME